VNIQALLDLNNAFYPSVFYQYVKFASIERDQRNGRLMLKCESSVVILPQSYYWQIDFNNILPEEKVYILIQGSEYANFSQIKVVPSLKGKVEVYAYFTQDGREYFFTAREVENWFVMDVFSVDRRYSAYGQKETLHQRSDIQGVEISIEPAVPAQRDGK
jgi:hypothetical protein